MLVCVLMHVVYAIFAILPWKRGLLLNLGLLYWSTCMGAHKWTHVDFLALLAVCWHHICSYADVVWHGSLTYLT